MVGSKLSGAFYTPKLLAEWVVSHLSKNFNNRIEILEPSCGDGIFIDILSKYSIPYSYIDAVEIDSIAISNVKHTGSKGSLNAFNNDFLDWNSEKKYGLVVGNPPYITHKRLNSKTAELCRLIHVRHGLQDRKVSNIWTAFLLKSIEHLSDSGIIAFVLPTEILQVKYAEEIRTLLHDTFKRLEIITFRKLAFDNIEQDTVVLFAYKNADLHSSGIYIFEVDNLDQLKSSDISFTHLPEASIHQKWITGILTEKEILLAESYFQKSIKSSDCCLSYAGIVTGANDYFILDENKIRSNDLTKLSKKILKKSSFVSSSVDFSIEDFDKLSVEGKGCYLLDTNGVNKFSNSTNSYFNEGVKQGINSRYKCEKRSRWHDVPGIKKDKAFFFKRSYDYPKCIRNSADVYVTDTAYQIQMKQGYLVENFIFSFYNSLTLLAAEMHGRYYGGGVLELTPNEFKSLPVPYITCDDFDQFAKDFKTKSNIDDILERNDELILIQGIGMSQIEVKQIQQAYKKMKKRRMRIWEKAI